MSRKKRKAREPANSKPAVQLFGDTICWIEEVQDECEVHEGMQGIFNSLEKNKQILRSFLDDVPELIRMLEEEIKRENTRDV